MVDFTGFRDWVGRQNPDKTYLYMRPDKCALALYLRDRYNTEEIRVLADSVEVAGVKHHLPREIDDAVSGRAPGQPQHEGLWLTYDPNSLTFGALSERLRSLEGV